MIDNESIAQKCYGISVLWFERGKVSLDPKRANEIAKYDARIDYLIQKLVEYIKDETRRDKK